jgi:hypothetical protein
VGKQIIVYNYFYYTTFRICHFRFYAYLQFAFLVTLRYAVVILSLFVQFSSLFSEIISVEPAASFVIKELPASGISKED